MNKNHKEIVSLCSELMTILNTIEETDTGREFYPTKITTTRVSDSQKLQRILNRLNELLGNK